jgi:hypothetical protein
VVPCSTLFSILLIISDISIRSLSAELDLTAILSKAIEWLVTQTSYKDNASFMLLIRLLNDVCTRNTSNFRRYERHLQMLAVFQSL